MSHSVDFRTSGAAVEGGARRSVQVAEDTTLLAAALLAGLPVAQGCTGDGLCGRCGLEVLEGARSLSAENGDERAAKERNRVDAGLRLACRAVVHGSVTVRARYW